MIREESIELPSGRFHLLRAGAGAPLAIVLHGFPDHPPSFEPLVRALAAGGYSVVAPWLRGYSPSTLDGPYHIDRIAADVLELATALGHERFVLVGHDWGAVATYSICAAAPERVLAAVTMAVPHPLAMVKSFVTTGQLARSWYMLFFQLPGAPRAVRARDFAFVDWLWRRWSPGARLDDDHREALHACLAASMPAPVMYYRAMARARPSTVPRRIATPLLALQGADDGCVAPSAARGQERFFTGPFEAEVIPGAGHFLQVEVPELIASRALDWFAAHVPASRYARGSRP